MMFCQNTKAVEEHELEIEKHKIERTIGQRNNLNKPCNIFLTSILSTARSEHAAVIGDPLCRCHSAIRVAHSTRRSFNGRSSKLSCLPRGGTAGGTGIDAFLRLVRGLAMATQEESALLK